MVTINGHQSWGREAIGCWFDGANGRYIGTAVIDEALAMGWQPKDYTTEDFDADAEFYHEAWDAAENYLAQFAADNCWIGSNESGDFGMWEVEADEVPA